ncbi:STRA6-like [Neosynchiropus ocellatus]
MEQVDENLYFPFLFRVETLSDRFSYVCLSSSVVVDCQNGIYLDVFLHVSLVSAVLITVVLSFLQRRANIQSIDHKLPFLRGRFAIVIPLDTTGSLSNRWSYGFAFGAVSYSVLLLFSETYIPFSVPNWAKAVVYLIGALEVGLVNFPFFACLSTPFRTVGAVLGILYSLSWIIVTVWDTFTCPDGKILGKNQKIVVQWPCILSLVFLLGRFFYMLIKGVRIQLELEPPDSDEMVDKHQLQHVKRLLMKTSSDKEPLSWFQRTVYEWDPHFKFPNRIIGTAIISVIGLYAMTLADYSLSSLAFGHVDSWKETLKQLVTSCNQTQALGGMIPQLEEFIDVARKTWLATTVFASLNSVVYTLHVLACYRKHLKRLWKGEKGFIPEKLHTAKSATNLASIARYSGWQIAFTLWGYLIVHFIHFLVALLFVYIFVIPIQHGRAVSMLKSLGTVILTIGLVIGTVILQMVLVQIFFLQDKLSPTDKYKPLAINNKKAFDCFNYFFFFYNVVMGFSTCILRLILSVVVGTWLVSRIDRTIMQRGYEKMDAGYRTWIGMIIADHYHNNPTMVCFCQLLISNTREKQTTRSYVTFDSTAADGPGNSRAKRRWALFYTLLRNPHLILHRKHHLSSAALNLSAAQMDTAVRAWVMTSQLQIQQSVLLPEIIVTQEDDC